MSRIIAIGDIHGCSKTLRHLISKTQLRKEDSLVFIGDYVDRGPDSKGVVDYILELSRLGYETHALRGNHEQIMLESDRDIEYFNLWLMNGGQQTLRSFGVKSFSEMEEKYRDFFQRTELYWISGNYIFVHAGLDFTTEDPFENEEAMLWIRGFEVMPEKIEGRTIIHGHTPVPASFVPTQKNKRVIDIDAGCVYKTREGYGYLYALCLPEQEFIGVQNID